jgi:hypothetical protein
MVGWVLVSYFLIAGGFTMAAAAVALLGLGSEPASQAVFFIGALIGGVVAGRASPHKAIVEPAIAGLLVVVTLVCVFMVELDRRFSWNGDGALAAAIKMGLVSGLGGFVGGLIGRRSRRGIPDDSALRWWGIATLINLGATFILVLVVLLLAGRAGDASSDSAVFFIFLGLILAAIASGFITQSVAPRRMLWTCGAGTISIVLLSTAFSVANGELTVSTMVGASVIWGLGTLVAAFGALLGWHLIARRIEPPSAVELPEVRVHS